MGVGGWVDGCVHMQPIRPVALGMQKMYSDAEQGRVSLASCYFHSTSQRQDAVKGPGDCAAVVGRC